MGNEGRVRYPSDVSHEEWSFVLPYLLLSREDTYDFAGYADLRYVLP